MNIQEQWIASSEGTPPDYLPDLGVYEDLLYQSYATDYDAANNSYFSSAVLSSVELEHDYRRRGLSNEWRLGFGRSFGPAVHVGLQSSSGWLFYQHQSVHIKKQFVISFSL